jgi:hypothetical protein
VPSSAGKDGVGGVGGNAALVVRVARHCDVAVQAPHVTPRIFHHVPSLMLRNRKMGVKGGLAPKWVGKSAVLEWQEAGLRAHVTRGTALVGGALLREDADVLAAAGGVSGADGKARAGGIAGLRGTCVEGLGRVGFAVAVANDCDAMVEVIHALAAGVVLVPARKTPLKQTNGVDSGGSRTRRRRTTGNRQRRHQSQWK